MSKVAVIYWSGTGNTEKMANFLADGVKEAGSEVAVMTPGEVVASELSSFTSVALGCPSMGDEVLEECDFQPMWDEIKNALRGKKVLLFGSYGWGDGLWMRNWQEECDSIGLNVVDAIICQEDPAGDTESKLKDIAKSL